MKEVEVKIRPSEEYIDVFKLPKRGSKHSACFDCYAYNLTFNADNNTIDYDLGFSYEIPDNYHLEILPRSSVYKTGLRLCNSVGILDADYRGQVRAVFYTDNADIENIYLVGDRVCQMMLVKNTPTRLSIVSSINETKRGIGGFGSTGNK